MEATRAAIAHHAREMADWVLRHRVEFGAGDQFQIIIGWPESIRATGRQIVKIWADDQMLARIADGTAVVIPREGWTKAVEAFRDR